MGAGSPAPHQNLRRRDLEQLDRVGVFQDAADTLEHDIADISGLRDVIAHDAHADAIRDQLLAEGVILEDKAEGTIWRREG